jgi:D-alanyl-D-alanine carboxypeptidase
MTILFSHFRKALFKRRLAPLHRSLGIPPDYARVRELPVYLEPAGLVDIGDDIHGRPQRLIEPAARAWGALVEAAEVEGVELQLVSAFRSVEYQEAIIRRKLNKGQSMQEILSVSAAPGYSEHHSGRAVDVSTPGFEPLEEEFERSGAFAWLCSSARGFGFCLSYPRGNPHGVAYEPWHWAWWGDSPRKLCRP